MSNRVRIRVRNEGTDASQLYLWSTQDLRPALHDQKPARPPGGDSLDRHLIERILAGEASPAERVAFDRWAGTDERRREMVARVAAATHGLRRPRYDADQAWLAVSRQMHSPDAHAAARGGSPSPSPLEGPAPSRWLANTAGIAAAAGICALAAGIAWRSLRPAGGQSPVAAAPESPQVAITGRGQRLTVTLLDGSHVTLAPDSRLTAPAGFGRTTREVTLDGKAYFEVVHDSLHPFTVIAAGERIRDIGTQFVVDAYTHDQTPGATPAGAATRNQQRMQVRVQVRMQVAVSAGAVRIESPPVTPSARPWASAVGEGGATIVTAGEIARVDARGQTTVIPHADVAGMKGWTSGELVFERSSLGDVVRELERWYDIDIVISDPSLAQRRVTRTFRGMPISHVLNTLAIAVNARCWWSGHTVTISPLAESNEPPL
jgi:transmembrane sensor